MLKSGLAALFLLATAAPAAAFDAALYAELLTQHTRSVADTAGTRVDYTALASSAEWRRVVASLASGEPEPGAPRAAVLAFWINAYNVLAIDVVLAGYPLDSIKDRGGFLTPVWKLEAGRVGGRVVTLHEIEHEILRPLGDPRIHAAIVCASTSCPSLQREPFRAADIDAQLDAAMQAFLADPNKGLRIDRAAVSVQLSSIFDWFAKDFGGESALLAYVARYAPERDRAWLTANADTADVEFFDYDWGLNDTRRTP